METPPPAPWTPLVDATRQQPRLLDRVRIAIRARHYSLRTEEAYVGWIRRFVIFNGKRHPETMGAREINGFLSHLADSRSDVEDFRAKSETRGGPPAGARASTRNIRGAMRIGGYHAARIRKNPMNSYFLKYPERRGT